MAVVASHTAVSSHMLVAASGLTSQSTSPNHLCCSFLPSRAPQRIRAVKGGQFAVRIQPRVARRTALRVVADGETAVAEAAEAPPAEEPVAAVAEAPVVSKKKKKKEIPAPSKKQLLILRFLWLEKNMGIAVEQLVPGQGTVPVSSYMFWPRKDAWEQLKQLLDARPWVSRKRAIILLNQATDIINLWQTTTFKQ